MKQKKSFKFFFFVLGVFSISCIGSAENTSEVILMLMAASSSFALSTEPEFVFSEISVEFLSFPLKKYSTRAWLSCSLFLLITWVYLKIKSI